MSQKKILLLLCLVQLLFGINFSASKVIVDRIDPLLWSNIRFFVAGAFMILWAIVSKRKLPKLSLKFLKSLVLLSLLGMGLGQGLFLFGLKFTSSINTSIITTMIPLITLFLVVIRRQEELTLKKLIGITLGLMGVVFMRNLAQLSFSEHSFTGDLLVFLGACCFACYLSFGKNFLQSHDNVWVTGLMFIVSGLFLIPLNWNHLLTFSFDVISTDLYVPIVFSIFGATILTYFLNNLVLSKARPVEVALFIYLQPIIAAVIGTLFLGETLNARTIICFMFIFLGMLVSLSEKVFTDRQ